MGKIISKSKGGMIMKTRMKMEREIRNQCLWLKMETVGSL